MKTQKALMLVAAAGLLLLALPAASGDSEFEAAIKRVDRALKENPGNVPVQSLNSCMARRNFALQLYQSNRKARAERSLKFCFEILNIPETSPKPVETAVAQPKQDEARAHAARELEKALGLTPNIERGLEIYRSCALCHQPEGWGLKNGSVPQIAGQHHNVVIKQLADIRAGNREATLMFPYASAETIGGPQAVADVAGYIDTLEINVDTGKGPGDDLTRGKQLYAETCARCHGPEGEGDAAAFVPRLQAQHFNYLVRQFERIRNGKRHNANPEMVRQVASISDADARAMLDYVSRLEPPEELQAPPGWRNPDFAD